MKSLFFFKKKKGREKIPQNRLKIPEKKSLTNEVKTCNNKDYKILGGNRENSRKCKDWSRIDRVSIVRMDILPKATPKITVILIKIPMTSEA